MRRSERESVLPPFCFFLSNFAPMYKFNILLIMLLLGMQSMAQTSRLDSIHTLRDVAVVGVRPHYLTPSQTLQGAMLQNLSTTSVADALKYFSGVQIKDYGGLGGLNKVKGYFSLKNLMFVDAEYQHTKGNYGFRFRSEQEDTVGRRNNSDITFYRIEAAGFYRGLSTHIYYYNSERGLPGPVIRRLSDQWDSTDRQWDQNFFVQSSYKHAWEHFALKTNIKYAYDYLHYLQDPNTNASTMFCDNHYTQQDIYGSIAGAWNTRYLSLTASTDLRWTDLNADVYKFDYVYRIDSKSLLSAIASYRGFEANVALLYTHISDHTRSAASPLSRLAPMYLASWHGGPWTVRAFHKRIFRAPTLNDLYYTLVGNVQLRPEYTSQWDMGGDYKDKYLHLALDMYYNRIEDKIVAIPMKCQFRWSMVNFGLVKSLGLSATAGYDRQWGKFSLSTNANYTCQRDRDYSSPADPEYKNTIPYSPLHSASLILDFGYDGYSLCTSWLYTGDRFALISNNREDMLGDWYTVDLKLNKQFHIGKHNVQATIECNNLTDSRHEVVKRYPMPGRNWKFTLQWKI